MEPFLIRGFFILSKTFLVLSIYDSLVSGKEVTRKEFCERENISERTFYRYMKNVSDYINTTDRANDFSLRETDGIYRLTSTQAADGIYRLAVTQAADGTTV